MDELRGPTIQIVLHIREGLGFGFLKNPFLVSGSLNGYLLETDPVVPCHAPVFDAELVWEADKRRFRNLRVQNVPIKIEVYTSSTQGKKDKVGYVLYSLLSAQPCPTNKSVNIKNVWYKLLGVKSEGKCCHPQLLLSLTVEDRVSTPTPRNELRIFHTNEIAYLSANSDANTVSLRSNLHTYNEYIKESQKIVSAPDLQPKLLCDEGLIQIGENCKHIFILSFVTGAMENVDLLLPNFDKTSKETSDCYVDYSVFTNNIMTDRVPIKMSDSALCSIQFNQRTNLRLCTDLYNLSRYFAECPYVITKLCLEERVFGICSMDLRKLVPTQNIKHFLETFCNTEKALTINERCFILSAEDTVTARDDRRKCYIDIEMCLKYLGMKKGEDIQKPLLTTRSASQLPTDSAKDSVEMPLEMEVKSGSCSHLDQDLDGVAYTNITARNTNRYKTASGDASLQTNEIADMIRKMYDSFALSQEKLLASKVRPATSDMQVQCEPIVDILHENDKEDEKVSSESNSKMDPMKCDTQNECEKDKVKLLISPSERDAIMQKFVEELEDWKEKQQELYRCQLERKEAYHLDLLAKEWAKKRLELESKLSKGIDQCRNLATDLSRATEDFRLRGFRNCERERKLTDAKKALEQHFVAKYQELREASQKMEDDMNHHIKLKDMRIEELELKVQQLEKHIETIKNDLKSTEKEAENKYSGLTKDQTTSLIQELRNLEERLEGAVQSKAFFKEQWGRAVRELHCARLQNRTRLLTQLREDRRLLKPHGLDTVEDNDEAHPDEPDENKMKDDFYVDILKNAPTIDSHSLFSDVDYPLEALGNLKGPSKNHMTEKLNELIKQRDEIIGQDVPNEGKLTQLNQEIRNILLNYGT